MGSALSFTVHGTPAPQGSKSAFAIRKAGVYTGRVAVVNDNKGPLRTWRQDVKNAAALAMTGPPLAGPLGISVIFTVPKPASAPKRTRTWPCKRPDLDKLLRSTLDALTGEVFADDAQIVRAQIAKAYPGEDEHALGTPGATITVWCIQDAAMGP